MKKRIKQELKIMREELQTMRHRIMDIRDEEKLGHADAEEIAHVESGLENAEDALEVLTDE